MCVFSKRKDSLQKC